MSAESRSSNARDSLPVGAGRGESLASRSAKLSQLVMEKGNQDLPYRHLVSREALLDALFALYDECNNDHMRRNKNIAQFIEKYHPAVNELRRLQVGFSDFDVRKVIGKGHFGEVHLVQEKQSGNIYAMKILKKSLTLEQQSVAFYEEERDIMMKGSGNPWLTCLQYSFQDSRHLYLVMEFLPGGDMLSLLERNDNLLPEDVAQFYLAEIVLALQSLHAMGYVHRDIKPDNILIDRTGHIKLADFGSAAKLNDAKQVTSKMPVGTPDYIAPEVLTTMNKGAGPHYGVGCDWWSLGIVAYEMLFGVTPFGDDKVLVTYANIMNFKEKLTFPDDIVVSDAAIALIRGLLQDAKSRLSQRELYDHDFFKDIDWMNLSKLAPPYVPTVTSQDDTSHFDDFDSDSTNSSRFVEPFNPKKEFSGKNLPFVGFTYSSCLAYVPEMYGSVNDTLNSMASSGSFMRSSLTLPRNHGRSSSGNSKESQLKKQMVAMEALESSLKSDVARLQAKCKRLEEQSSLQQEDRDKTLAQTAEMEAEVRSLRHMLDLEHKNSSNTEKRAVELVKALEQKYKKRETQLKEAVLHLCNGQALQTGSTGLLALTPCEATPGQDSIEQQLSFELFHCKQELSLLKSHASDSKLDLNERASSSVLAALGDNSKSSGSSDECSRNSINSTLSNGTVDLTVIPRDPMAHVWKERLRQADEALHESEKRVEQMSAELLALKSQQEEALRETREEYAQQVNSLKKVIARLESSSLSSLLDQSHPFSSNNGRCHEQDLPEHDSAPSQREANELIQEKFRVMEADLALNQQFLESLQKKYDKLKESTSSRIQALETDLCDMRKAKGEVEKALSRQEDEFKDQMKSQEAAVVEQLSLAQEAFQEQLGQLQLRSKEVDAALTQLETSDRGQLPQEDFSHLDGPFPAEREARAVPPNQLSFRSTTGSSLLSPEMLQKMMSMEAVLHKIHETQISECNQIWELKAKLWKCEKEVSDRQLDVRIAEREKREIQESLAQSRESQRHLREKLSALDKEHAQSIQRESSLKDQLTSALREAQAKEESWQAKLNRVLSEKQVLDDRILTLKEERKVAKDLEEQCARSEGQYKELDRQNEWLKDQTEKLEDEKQRLLGEIESLQLDLRNKTKNCQQLEKSVLGLKQACTTLEGITKDLEEGLENKERDLLHSKQAEASLQREVEKLRRELKSLDDTIHGEKKYREEREVYLSNVRSEHNSELRMHEERELSMEAELGLQAEELRQLSSQVFQLEKEHQNQVALRRALEAKNISLDEENVRIKEEASMHITTIAQLKRKSIDLQESLEGAEARIQEALWTIEQMHNESEREKASFHQELVKQDAQLQQHAKLIDLLQQRLGTQNEKKKKWLFGGLRGNSGKENKGPMPSKPPLPVEKKRDRGFRQYVELREAIPKMSAGNEMLASEPPQRSSSRGSHDQVSLAGSTSSGEDSIRSSFHIFYESSVKQAGVCVACALHIPSGRATVRCRGCDVVCHRSCKELVPRSCPPQAQLPVQGPLRKPMTSTDFQNMGGWVKTPRNRNAGWERRFMRIVGSNQLWISDREIPSGPTFPPPASTSVLNLCPEDGVVTLKKALTPGDLQYTSTDVQNMIRLTSWPDNPDTPNNKDQIVLLGEYDEKWRWCQALERVLDKHLKRKGKIISYSELKSSLVLNLEKFPLQVTCCNHLTKRLLLLGSTSGLHLVDLSLPPQLALVGCLLPQQASSSPTKAQTPPRDPVHRILLAQRLAMVLLVTGSERQLRSLKAEEVLEWSECCQSGALRPSLSPSPVANLRGIYHLEVSQCPDVKPVVLAACSVDTFYLLKWNTANRQFVIKQEVKLYQPCSALHMSPTVVLFAADKVYVVDLKEPGTCVEEFLDSSNANALTLVVTDILKRQSSPVAIFTATCEDQEGPRPKPVQEDFLLLTRDMGVLVNYLGQQDQQNQLGWALQPNAFGYCSPFLFSLDSQQVEMVLVDLQRPNLRGPWCFLELSQAQFLGLSSLEEKEVPTIYVSSVTSGNVVEIFRIQGHALLARHGQQLERNTSTASSVSEAFSFTSSLEDALDTADSSTC